MKQKKFWSKLLSLGLAAAMTIASLTGPGSVTNPVEVKAADERVSAKATFSVEDSLIYDGTEKTPAITIKSSNEGEGVTVTSGSPFNVKVESNSKEYNVMYSGNKNAGQATAKISSTTNAAIQWSDEIEVKFTIGQLVVDKDNIKTYFDLDTKTGAVTFKSTGHSVAVEDFAGYTVDYVKGEKSEVQDPAKLDAGT